MNDTIRIQAALHGVTPERMERLQALGLTKEQFASFANFDDDFLVELAVIKLDADELLSTINKVGNRPAFLRIYAQLRKRGIASDEILALHQPDYFLHGLEEGLSVDLLRQADQKNIMVRDLEAARNAEVSYSDVFEVAAVRKGSLGKYIEARVADYPHRELIAVLELANPAIADFDIDDYLKVRQRGVSHAQVMEMLHGLRDKKLKREYYVQYVTDTWPMSVSHDEAYELARLDFYPNSYYKARRQLSHQQIIAGLDQGIGMYSLAECSEFLAKNSRIKPEEVLQHMIINGQLTDINEYIKLIDLGATFEEVKAARGAGAGLWEYGQLRSEPLSLTHDEVMRAVSIDIPMAVYLKLRREGMTHDTIVQSLTI